MPQNPLDLLREFVKEQSDKYLNTRKLFDRPNTPPKIRSAILGSTPEIKDDPNFVDITPKDVPPKWYQDANDPAFQPSVPMRVMRPPMFRTPTQVLGGSEFANDVERLLTDVPELRGRVKTIQHGPTSAALGNLAESKFGPQDFGRTNLMGIYDPHQNDVGINPSLNSSLEPLNTTTIGHEIGHSMGLYDNEKMDAFEKLIEDYVKSRSRK